MTGEPRYVVVDSSVAFKWFCDDDESSVDKAAALFQEHVSGRIALVAPPHLPAEVLNALGCRPTITASQLQVAAEGLAESDLAYPTWDGSLLGEAARLARKHRLTVNDALFPALAIQLGCELVTADRAHCRVKECTIRLLP